MEGKKLIKQADISFTNGTRVITLANGSLVDTLLNGDVSRVFFIYNDTQKVYYYAPEASISLVTITADNQITIDSSLAVLATGNILKILIWDSDNTENQETGVQSNQEINPARNWSDSAIPQTTTLSLGNWASFGSSITGEQNTVFSVFNSWTLGTASLTAVQIKVIGRFDSESTENYGMPDVLWDKNTRAIELEDSTDPFVKIYQLDRLDTQKFLMFLQFGNAVPTIELYIKIIGVSAASASHVSNIVKSWASAIPVQCAIKNYQPKTLIDTANLANGVTVYYPSSDGELLGSHTLDLLWKQTAITLSVEFNNYSTGGIWVDATASGVIVADNDSQTNIGTSVNTLSATTVGKKLQFIALNEMRYRIKATPSNATNVLYIESKKIG